MKEIVFLLQKWAYKYLKYKYHWYKPQINTMSFFPIFTEMIALLKLSVRVETVFKEVIWVKCVKSVVKSINYS